MRIPAIKVNQWLEEWDAYRFSEEDRQRKPEPYFYLSSIPATLLRRLLTSQGGASPHQLDASRLQAPGLKTSEFSAGMSPIDRKQLKGFMLGGYPWATLRKAEQDSHLGLKKPGWLATALVLNVVKATTVREGISPKP